MDGNASYHEIICYASSLMQTAQQFAPGIGEHWAIKNPLHSIEIFRSNYYAKNSEER